MNARIVLRESITQYESSCLPSNLLSDSAPDVSQPEREIGENFVRERHSPGGATETPVGHSSFVARAGVRELVPRATTKLVRRQRSPDRPCEVCRSRLHVTIVWGRRIAVNFHNFVHVHVSFGAYISLLLSTSPPHSDIIRLCHCSTVSSCFSASATYTISGLTTSCAAIYAIRYASSFLVRCT